MTSVLYEIDLERTGLPGPAPWQAPQSARRKDEGEDNSLNNTQYVDTLLNMAGVTLASRQAMIDGLNAGTLTRAQVLRQIADSNEVATRYFNQAYSVMEYLGTCGDSRTLSIWTGSRI